MKRFFTLLLMVAMVSGLALVAQSSQPEVLIDFSQLNADYPAEDATNDQDTLIDFSGVAGTSYTDEEKAQMKTSLAIENWEVVLASSSRSVINQALSMTKESQVRGDAAQYPNEYVMGIRVHFPMDPFNSWAIVKPPFEIPAYADITEVAEDGSLSTPQEEVGAGRKFDGYGVVKNVGVLKTVAMNVYGSNFPHTMTLLFQDENNQVEEIYLGDLQFDGWKTLVWNNPNYISEVRNRELRTFPLYPRSAPMRKLIGLKIYRDASVEGGDFITYVKDIAVQYDKAILNLQRDIDDEATWGILQQREQARRNAELKRLGYIQVLRYLESKKMVDESTAE